MENSVNITNLVKEYYKKHGITMDANIDACVVVLRENPELKEQIAAVLGNEVNDSDLINISNNMVSVLVDLVIDEKNIKVVEDTSYNVEDDGSYEELNAFKLYMRDVNRFELLTREQEIALFTRIYELEKDGKEFHMDEINQIKSEIACRNLKLVIKFAKSFVTDFYDINAACQDGNLGLLTAIDKFDFTKGYKFSTYATWWIRQSVRREKANNLYMIRIPVHMYEKMNAVRRYREKFLIENGDYPTVEQIGKEFSLDDEKVMEILKLQPDTLSLNEPINNGDGEEESELMDFLPNDSLNPEEEISRKMLKETLVEVLDELTVREKFVVAYRSGLGLTEKITLEDAGKCINRSLKETAYIYGEALSKVEGRVMNEINNIKNHFAIQTTMTKDDRENEIMFYVSRILKDVLTPTEYFVFTSVNGIPCHNSHTLEEIGQMFNITRERVRQIEAKAMRKLRHPSRSRKLRGFLDEESQGIYRRS